MSLASGNRTDIISAAIPGKNRGLIRTKRLKFGVRKKRQRTSLSIPLSAPSNLQRQTSSFWYMFYKYAERRISNLPITGSDKKAETGEMNSRFRLFAGCGMSGGIAN